MTNTILDFHAEAWFFFTLFIIQNMMNSFPNWESSQTKEKSSDFVKRVSFWHENTLNGMMKQVATTHNPPSFVPAGISDLEAESRFDLHTNLLNEVSSLLIKKYSEGLGQQTSYKIVQWFLILKDPALQNLLNKSSTDARNVFNNYTYQFENLPYNQQHPQDKEFPFFCPKILFIYITHLVSLYTNSPYSNVSVIIFDGNYSEWEEISGSIVQSVLDLKTDGLTILLQDNETLSDQSHTFGPINLPYQEWSRTTSEKRESIPSLDHLQELVLGKVSGHIRETLSKQPINEHNVYEAELRRITDLFVLMHGFTTNRETRNKLKNKEKQRKYHRAQIERKYQARDKPYNYKPRPPTYFQHDIFTMGHQSYYYYFHTKHGKEKHDFLLGMMAMNANNETLTLNANNETLTPTSQCVVS